MTHAMRRICGGLCWALGVAVLGVPRDAVAQAARQAATGPAAADTMLAQVRAIGARRVQGDTAGIVAAYEGMLARLDVMGAGSTMAAEETMRGLSFVLFQRREYARAQRYAERLAPLVDSLAGPESAAAAQEWHNLAFLRDATGQFDGAIAASERALAVRQRVLPPRDPLTLSTQLGLATSLRRRAAAHAEAGRSVPAWNDYERALAVADSADGPQSEASAEAVLGMVQLMQALSQGDGDMLAIGVPRLVALGDRALAMLEKEFGADHPQVRNVRAYMETFRLGATSMSLDPRAVREVAQRSVAAAEAAHGAESAETAQALLRLARAEIDLREFAAARATLDRALRLRTASAGENSEPVAEVQRVIGTLLQAEGRLPEARAQMERALAMAERAVGGDAPALVPYLKALADLLRGLGDTQQAQRLTTRADRLEAEVAGDVDSPMGAVSALLRANQLEDAGKRDEARVLRERSLVTLVRTFGEGHIVVAVARFQLAQSLIAMEDFAAAGALIAQGIIGTARTFGEESPEFAVALTMQSQLQKAMQDYAAAEVTLRRIVALNARTLGPAHPQGFVRRFDLADMLMTQRKATEAAEVVRDVTRDVDRYAREILPTLAVAEQQAFLEQTLPIATNFALMSIHIHRQDLPLLYSRLAGWKGLLLRGIDRQAAVARMATERGASADLRRLSAVRDELTELVQRMASTDAARMRRERERLTEEKEALERRLAALVPESPDPWRDIEALRKKMPAHTAFIDIFRHGSGTQSRYAMVAVLADAKTPVYTDLGPAARIDRFVADWRRAVTSDQFGIDEFWRVVGSTVDEIAKVMPDSLAFIWISPDAQLSRLPWATLTVYNRRLGVANAAQVPSARALMTLLDEPPTTRRGGVALVGGVDFEAGQRSGQRPSTRWQALPGTATEIDAIARLAASRKIDARRVTGAAATPRTVSAMMDSASVVHLATHGFFFGESESVANSRGVVGASPLPPTPTGSSRNPLAESGLALAGANVNAAGNLTAEQILGMDLRGLQLVVLSACETGRGAEVTGQGVLGLQASLLSAGSRGMLMSLWKVPDESTALLMERFYTYYFDGSSAADALRRAQSDVLRDERFKNPVHWAGWVYVGTIDG